MSITICDYASWNDFKKDFFMDLYNEHKFIKGKYIFRGQSNSEWKIESSFDRIFREYNKKKRKTIERLLLDEFISNHRNEIKQSNIDNVPLEHITALAQHYGLPTRLVDWSISPYIACFFAFCFIKPPELSTKVSIYALNSEHEIWSSDYGVKIVTNFFMDNDHQKRQMGLFTYNTSPESSIEDFLEHCAHNNDVSRALIKATIPISDSKLALSDLDAMNINHRTLFSGVKGCADAALLNTIVNLL